MLFLDLCCPSPLLFRAHLSVMKAKKHTLKPQTNLGTFDFVSSFGVFSLLLYARASIFHSLTHIHGLLGEGGFDQGEEGSVDTCVVRLELVRRQIKEGGIHACVRLVVGVGAAGQRVACLGLEVGERGGQMEEVG